SSTTGSGLVALREALVELRDRVRARRAGGDLGGGPGRGPGPTRLAIDRVFAVRGRGVVVTGSLRGGAIERGRTFRLEPGGRIVRAREVQVHGAPVEHATPGRVALNLAGVELDQVHRGMVLGDGAAVEVTERVLVGLRPAVALAGGRARAEGAGIAAAAGSAGNTVGVAGAGSAGTAAAAGDRGVRHGLRVRLHLGTAQVDGAVDLTRGAVARYLDGSGRAWTTAVLRLDEPVATAFGDAFVLRRPSPGETLAGGLVLDPNPPHGISRRRATPERLAALGQATGASDRLADRLAALVELHGALPVPRAAALLAAAGAASSGAGGAAGSAAGDPTSSPAALEGRVAGSMILAADVSAALDDAAISIVAEHAATDALAIGAPVAAVRTQIGRELRRRAFVPRDSVDVVAAGIVDQLVATGRITQSGDRLRIGGADSGPSRELRSAMDRLELALSVAAPASLTEAASSAGCPLDGIRALESAGRIVRVEDDLAWAAPTYLELEALAQRLAASGPLSPAAFRDATGTSRRYSLTILEDLDRRGLLRRTPAGHVLGPRANLARTRS
ncbi:MAG TPA: SelB C-terminal domain-containing protein, partial [Candidatus Saccharimonadales bacterium]|nr:SelB C-terminal domain-containing protein [Candidatus Saccharimonadales bacterium]